ncbi:hypothetical protein [Cellulomonas sp. ICMP 17802]|uniref:hypothetical protein n=1 Tax=Cellulomonas sp. ICMP 17802 TaxID=3239199 RepID=UPI00351B6A11
MTFEAQQDVVRVINACLLFLAVLGSSVTLHSAVQVLRTVWMQETLSDARRFMGTAADSGLMWGVLWGLPMAVGLVTLYVRGWAIVA